MAVLFRIIGLPILLGFFFIAAYLFFYLGVWKSVDVTQTEEPPMHLLYVTHVGPYHKISERIEVVETWARSNQVSCSNSFGEYLDDPEVVDEDRLRSHAGCVVDRPLQAPEGFEFRTEPSQTYIRAEYSGSPAIGPWKVYPRLKEYAQTHRLRRATRVFEVYTLLDGGRMSTLYLWPLEN